MTDPHLIRQLADALNAERTQLQTRHNLVTDALRALANLAKSKTLCDPPQATTLQVQFGPFADMEPPTMADAFTNQVSNGTLQILDAQGNPASVDGVPQWNTSDATVLTVTPAADGMSFQCFTIAPGIARLTVTADANLGTGISTITGVSEDVSVTQNPNTVASTFVIEFGPFTDISH